MRKNFRMLSFLLALFVGAGAVAVGATVPAVQTAEAAENGYYSSITAEKGTALLGQLHDLIVSTHKKYTSYDECKSYADETDPSGSGILEFYTHESYPNNFGSSTGVLNREHVWPKSLGCWETSNAGSDLHHIRPTEYTTNNKRGNDKYGDLSGGTEVHSSKGGLAGYISGGVFEPTDQVKGDAARIVMYVYTHYNTASRVYGTENSKGRCSLSFTNVISASSENAAIQLLLEWNELDPVDEIERTRNEAVYKIQGNRNPFIDNESYAEAIWGDGVAIGGGTDVGGGTGTATPTESFQPITEPQEGTYYLGMNVNGTYYYAQSSIVNNYYLGTTADISSASEYELIEDTANGGWIIKTGSKYLEAAVNDTHVNPKLNASQTSGKSWTWDSDHQVFIWTEGSDQAFLGNYNGYTNISGAFIKYIDQDYAAQLGTYGTGGTQGGGTTDPDTGGGSQGGTVTPPVTGETGKLTITLDSFTLTDGYGFKTWSSGGVSGVAYIYGGNVNYPDSPVTDLQFSKPTDGRSYYLANTTAVPGPITSITVKSAQYSNNWTVLTSDTSFGEVVGYPSGGTNRGQKQVPTEGVTWQIDGDDTFFAIQYDTTEYAGHLASVEITYATQGGTVDPGTGGGTVDPGTGGGTQGGTTTPTDGFTPFTEAQTGKCYLALEVNGNYLYATANMVNTYYIGTTTDVSQAAEFEIVKDGDLYLLKTGTKYLEISVNTGSDGNVHINAVYNSSRTAGKGWSWDSTHGIFLWVEDDGTYYLGNSGVHNDSISGLDMSKFDPANYLVKAGTVKTTETPGTQGGTTDPGTQGGTTPGGSTGEGGETPETPSESGKKGCGSVLGIGALAIVTGAAAAAFLFRRKK